MSKHKHADNMVLHAQDAMETDKPWERWEYFDNLDGEWVPTTASPLWIPTTEYRQKPKTILVNGIEIPAPYRGEVEDGMSVFCVDPAYGGYIWCTRGLATVVVCRRYRDLGLLHLTEENCQLHIEALRVVL